MDLFDIKKNDKKKTSIKNKRKTKDKNIHRFIEWTTLKFLSLQRFNQFSRRTKRTKKKVLPG